MSFNCGIIGLPNVGKSTIFNALTAAGAEASNYPFCTIDPNVGMVKVPDERLDKIAQIVKPEKIVYPTTEFVDIAGLVKGASHGEGLGNQFLSHIREVDALVHIVRCFVRDDVPHVTGQLNPISDIEIVNTTITYSIGTIVISSNGYYYRVALMKIMIRARYLNNSTTDIDRSGVIGVYPI